MLSFERIKNAIGKSGHSAQAVFDKLSNGRGLVLRADWENLACRFEPGITNADLVYLWQMTGKSLDGTLNGPEFVQFMGPASQPPVQAWGSPAAAVTSDWVEHVDPTSQQRFWYSASTGESSWTDPRLANASPSLPQPQASPNDWVENVDPGSGRVFFSSASTGRSEWTDPRTSTTAQTAQSQPSALAAQQNDWIEMEDPGTRTKYYHSAIEGRTTWTDRRFEQALSSLAGPDKQVPAQSQPNDWQAMQDPGTQKTYFYSAVQRRSSWTDHRFEQAASTGVAPSSSSSAGIVAPKIDDARFKQLLEYFSQVLQSRGQVASRYFDTVDTNRDGYLSSAEFSKALTDVGVNGVDTLEIQNVFSRIEVPGSMTGRALVTSVADAVGDPSGFIARAATAQQSQSTQASQSNSQRVTVQLRTSPLKRIGFISARSDDGRSLSITRIDAIGLLADWNAGQRLSQKIQVGDQIVEANGRSNNAEELSRALQLTGLLTLVIVRCEQTDKLEADKKIDDARFKQLLEYFGQLLQCRAQTAQRHFEALDLNRDGRLSSTEFIKGLTDLGVNGLEQAELQKVFHRLEGSGAATGSAFAQALVSSIADGITDPAGFIARKGLASTPVATNRIDDARFKQLLEYFSQVLRSRGQTARMYFDSVDLNRDGRISSDEFIKGLADAGVNGVERAELQKIFQQIEGSGLDNAQASVSSVADALTDPVGFIARMVKKPSSTPSSRFTVQLQPSALKKLGLGAPPSPDCRMLVVTRLDLYGLMADWNAGQRFSQKVQVGDQIVEVNGRSGNADDLVSGLQSTAALTIIFQRPDPAGSAASGSKVGTRQNIDDARFKQLLEYFNQVLQSSSWQTAARYFDSLDRNRTGRISNTEFTKGLTDLGVNGVEASELQKVFSRIEGSGSDFATALVSSVVDAITDPTGFMSKALVRADAPKVSKADTRTNMPDDRFKQLLEYLSQVLRSRSKTAGRYFESIDLNRDGSVTREEFLKGLTDLGVNGVDRAELKKVFYRIEGTGAELAQARVSSITDAVTDPSGFIARSAKKPPGPAQPSIRITAMLRPTAFKKLGMGAAPSGNSRVLNVTRIDATGLVADWNAEQRWSQKVQVGDKIVDVNGRSGNADDLASALQSQGMLTVVFVRSDDPDGVGSSVPGSQPSSLSAEDARIKQLLDYFKQVLQGRGLTAARYFENLDANRSGRMSSTQFIKGLTDLGVTTVENSELQKVFSRLATDFGQALVSNVVDAVTDAGAFMARFSVVPAKFGPDSPKVSKSEGRRNIDDTRFKQLLEHFNQTLRNRGQAAGRYVESLDVNRDGRLTRDEFLKGLADLGVNVERTELKKVFYRIEGTGSESGQAFVSSITEAITDPSGFIVRGGKKPLPPQGAPQPPSTRITVQVLPSVVKRLGLGTSPSADGKLLLVNRIDSFGLLADWNSMKRILAEKVQIGDQLVEVNGRGGSADDMTRALQSQGMLSMVFARR